MSKQYFAESGIQFDFSIGIKATKADEINYRGLSFVDFIVETDDFFYFIEVKNPDNRKATAKARLEFLRKLRDSIFPKECLKKFSDTLLSELARGKSFSKPIRYIYVLEFSEFAPEERLRLFEKVKNGLPYGLMDKNFVNVMSVDRFDLLNLVQFSERVFPAKLI